MSTLLTRAPNGMGSPAREGNRNRSAAEPPDTSTRISQRSTPTRYGGCPEAHRCIDEVERAGLRELLCEMLVSSVWEDGHGHVRTEGKNRDEDHSSATRA
jgi:hypothetical protein